MPITAKKSAPPKEFYHLQMSLLSELYEFSFQFKLDVATKGRLERSYFYNHKDLERVNNNNYF